MITIIRYFLMFVLVLFLQCFVLDYVPWDLPYSRLVVFFVFVISLPPLPAIWLMLISFAGGLVFDVFYTTPGINAAVCVFLAYIKDPLLKLFIPEEDNALPAAHITTMGFSRYFFYIVIISLIFHLFAEFISAFSFQHAGVTLLRVLFSSVLSVVLIYIYEIIFFYRKADAA